MLTLICEHGKLTGAPGCVWDQSFTVSQLVKVQGYIKVKVWVYSLTR